MSLDQASSDDIHRISVFLMTLYLIDLIPEESGIKDLPELYMKIKPRVKIAFFRMMNKRYKQELGFI